MPYKGELTCFALKKNGEKCTNKAYYEDKGIFACGVHSSKLTRKMLGVNPDRDKNREKFIQHIQQLAEEKKNLKGVGQVVLSKLRMMKEPEFMPGFIRVFPNYKHGGRKDGYGCPALSPKSMGPIEHGQPGLPPAKNLENFHQGNKCFPCELKGDSILPCFYETRLKMYLDPEPHRHKLVATGNIPVFSVWVDKKGEEHRISYIESRQFYCTFYERIALKTPEYQHLKKLLNSGYNLQIIGYDAPLSMKTPEEAYLDPSAPFGHEWVLYCLLVLQESEYPWRRYNQYL